MTDFGSCRALRGLSTRLLAERASLADAVRFTGDCRCRTAKYRTRRKGAPLTCSLSLILPVHNAEATLLRCWRNCWMCCPT